MGSISAGTLASNSSGNSSRRLWACPRGYVGKDQCDSSAEASQCCGYSVPGENCGDRHEDCFCYQWNCGARRLDAEAPGDTNSSSVAATRSLARIAGIATKIASATSGIVALDALMRKRQATRTAAASLLVRYRATAVVIPLGDCGCAL